MAVLGSSATKNRLMLPTGAPAPGPSLDASADAYAPGTMAVSSKGNALQMPSPFAQPKGPPRNALLASAFDGFQRGFDPAGYEKRQATNKADGMEKQKQTLALIQQQRALPAEQRSQWWQQNADTIGGIIGQDVRSMPIDPNQFTDQALDGHIAALSAQMGVGPTVPEPMTAYQAAMLRQQEEEAKRPQGVNLGGGAYAEYDPTAPAESRLRMLQTPDAKPADLPEGMWYGQDGKGPPQPIPGYVDMRARIAAAGRAPGDGRDDPPSGYRWNPDGTLSKIPGGPADKPEPSLYTPTEEKNYRSKAQALGTLKFLTNEYRTLVNQYDPGLFDAKLEDGEWRKTPEGQKLLSAHNNLMMFLKGPELFNLGVLTGPDVERLQRTLPEPVGMGAFGQTKETLGIGLNSLDQLVGYQMNMIPEELRSQKAVAAQGNQPNFLETAGQFVGNLFGGFGGQQRPGAPPQMRPPPPRQQTPDLSQMSIEELERALAEAEGR